MKPWQIVMAVIWVIIIASLVGLLVLGINGNLPWYNEGEGFNLFNISFGSRTNWGSEFDGIVPDHGTASIDASDITSLDVRWIGGTVKIEHHNDSEIKIEQYGEIAADRQLVYRVDSDGTLRMREGKNRIITSRKNTSLTVYVPYDNKDYNNINVSSISSEVFVSSLSAGNVKLNTVSGSQNATDMTVSGDVDIDTVSGSATVETLTVGGDLMINGVSGSVNVSRSTVGRKLSSETVSGSTRITDTTAAELKTIGVSGSTSAYGSFEDVNCETVSGSVSVDTNVCPRRVSVNTVSGSASLSIPDNDGFTARYSKVSGNFNCNFAVTSTKNTATYGNGFASFDFDTVSGEINIYKK